MVELFFLVIVEQRTAKCKLDNDYIEETLPWLLEETTEAKTRLGGRPQRTHEHVDCSSVEESRRGESSTHSLLREDPLV